MRWLLCLAFLVGCSHDVTARFPSTPAEPTGRLVLLLSQPASGVTVAINGQLVVEDQHTKRVTIDGVPTGTGEVSVAVNGNDKAFRVWIDSEHATTVPLGVPEQSLGFLKSILGTLISLTAYSLLH